MSRLVSRSVPKYSLVALGCLFLTLSVSAATWTWTGATNNNWNTASNWSPATVPTSVNTTVLNFNTSSSGTSNNNAGSPFTLNQMNFGATLGNFSIIGNGLNFTGTSPTLTNNNTAGAVTINNAINLSNLLGSTVIFTINGASNTVTNFTGVISDTLLGPPDDVVRVAGGTVNFTNSASSYGGGLSITGGTAVGTSVSSINITSSGNSFFGTGSVNQTGGRLAVISTGVNTDVTVNRNMNLASATAIGANRNVFQSTRNITIGSAANITLNNGSTLALIPGASGTITTQSNTATFTFGSGGGVLDIAGRLATNYPGQRLNINTTGANQAIINYASMNAANAWNVSQIPFFVGGNAGANLTGTGNLVLSMTGGALTQYSQANFGGSLTVSGVVGGDASATSTSNTVGRIAFDTSAMSGTTFTIANGIFFKNVNQVSATREGFASTGSSTIASNMTILDGETAFSAGAGGGISFGLGSSSANTLTVNNGATATMDFSFRTDITSGFTADLFLNSSTILNAGGILKFTRSFQSGGVTYGDIRVNGDITGQGTQAVGESTVLLEDSIGLGAVVSAPTTGTQLIIPNTVTLFVQGQGTNGLRIEGNSVNVDGFLSSTRLRTLVQPVTGSTTDQGTLTIAYNNNGTRTFTNADGPATASYIKLGFDAANGSAPIYTLNNSTGGVSGSTLTNWNGIVVKGGTVQLASNANFTGATGAASFTIQGGTFRNDNGAGTGFNATFAGDASLQAGTIAGGATGGILTIQGNAVKSTAGTVILGGKIVANGSVGLDIQQGTLSQTASNLIGNTTNMRLAGGVWATNGNSETLGTLTLAANSTIDMGAAGSSTIAFSNSAANTWTAGTVLSITNWSGTPIVGGGTDQLFFGTSSSGLTAAQINQIVFINPNGFAPGTYTGMLLANGELVPVPEPSTVFAGMGLALSVIAYELRRRKMI